MIVSESIAQMEKDSAWKNWAEKGWTLHPRPDGRVQAVNLAARMATEGAKNLDALLKQLLRGAYTYKNFVIFKKQSEAR